MHIRKISCIILFFIAVVMAGCNSNQTSFEDSIPLFSLQTNVDPTEAGAIEPSGGEFSTGESVDITAEPADGFVFERWEGDLGGNSNPAKLTFNADRTVTAHFVERDFNLTIEITGEGIVRETIIESSSEENESGRTVRLEAEPAENWTFSRWEGDLTGSQNPDTIEVNTEKSVSAIFDRDQPDAFTISIGVEGEGKVTKDPDRNNFAEGDEVTLTAVADSGWAFLEWRGDLTGTNNSLTVTVSENIEATAVFTELEDPSIEILSQPSKTVAGTPVSPAPEIKYTDEFGDPINDADISVSLNKNSFRSGSTTSATTNAQGVAVFDNLVIVDAETGYILRFSTNNSDVRETSSVPYEVVAASGDPSNSSAEVPDGAAGEPTEITISISDEFGNPVTGAANELTVEISGSNSASPSVSESGGGDYSASYTPTISGTDRIDIELNGQSLAGSPYNSVVGPGLPAILVIISQPTSTEAGESITPAPSIRVQDRFDNRLESVDVSAKLDRDQFTSESTTTVQTNNDGVATFNNLSITKASGSYSILFTAGDETQRSDEFAVRPASVDFSTTEADIPNGETGQETIITVTLRDRFNNLVPDSEDKLEAEVRGANRKSLTFEEAGSAGVYRASYVPISKGNDRIEIEFDDRAITGSPFDSQVAAADASPSNSTVSADPATLQADDTSIITVNVRDANGNRIGGLDNASFDIDITGNAFTGSVSETNDAGTYRFDVTNNSVETVMVTVSVNGITLSDTPEIIFEVGDPAEIIITVQPEDTESGETVNGPPTVRVNDNSGRPVPDVPVTVGEQNNTPFASGTLVVRTDESGTAVFDDLVFEVNLRFLNLVFSVDEVDDVTSNRFVVTALDVDFD